MRVQDLPDRPTSGVVLHCDRCGEDYSATKGDYFLAAPTTIMRCCGQALKLRGRRTLYLPVGVKVRIRAERRTQ